MVIKFDIVIFDVDSTLVKIEGLDWLAGYKGVGAKVVDLTRKSMEGTIDFNEAMISKMRLIAPSKADLVRLGNVYCQNVVDGAKELIEKLRSSGIKAWIITGNFQPAVGILADYLGIPREQVVCNNVYFDANGKYQSFNSNHVLAKNGGKVKIIKEIFGKRLKNKIAYVGDGITDLEVKDQVALFIGFGGVVERSRVKKEADKYISEPNLYSISDLIIGLNSR